MKTIKQHLIFVQSNSKDTKPIKITRNLAPALIFLLLTLKILCRLKILCNCLLRLETIPKRLKKHYLVASKTQERFIPFFEKYGHKLLLQPVQKDN